MNPPEFGIGGRARLDDGTAVLTKLGCHGLHHLSALDALGMTGRGQVVDESART